MIETSARPELQRELQEVLARPGAESTIPGSVVAELVARHRLGSAADLALLALPLAAALARCTISGFRVAAVGIEAETGDLVLGGNLEFPGTDLTTTVHAEGFVTLRARARGRTLATLAVREARPCAHCRQTLSESAAADGLTLVDLEGARRTLADLYPWPFGPDDLGVPGIVPGTVPWPDLAMLDPARARRGRHGAILLPFRALVQAIGVAAIGADREETR